MLARFSLVCLIALLLVPASGSAASAVQDFRAGLSAASRRSVERLAVARALGLVQNRLAEVLAAAKPGGVCGLPEAVDLAVRSERLGAAHRDAAQVVRAAVDRASALAADAGVAPLVSAAESAELEALEAAAEEGAEAHEGFAAWHRRVVLPRVAACAPLPPPTPGPGLSLPGPGARPIEPVPVLVVDGAFVCPGAASGPVVLVEGAACAAPDASCACSPAPVLPAAVLGP